MNKSYFKYWGKAQQYEVTGEYQYHLLPFHCLDVVAVANIWLSKSNVLLNQISEQLNKSPAESKAIVLFFIALHDLGKFDARFQNFVPQLRVKLQGDEFEVDKDLIYYPHGSAGFKQFSLEFCEEFESSPAMEAVAGHHGYCDLSYRYDEPDADEELIELDRLARKEWLDFCLHFFKLKEIPQVDEITMLTGLCSVSDWIGSSITNFTTDPEIDLQQYYQDTLKRADIALQETGMLSVITGAGFNYLFPHYQAKGIQTLLDKLPLEAGLTLVESDTGSGKTEFALAYASSLIYAGLADGIVFALPTQATANGLFKRIGEAANKLFPDADVTLAHGKSKYLYPDEDGFLHQSNKRAFLGSMSVATIDQILMGVLNIKHQFVRSFGTRKSVLIIDEIHSFDAYMVGLIEQVLKGQHQAFSSVILLSATLPFPLKEKLLLSYHGECLSNAYPLLTHVNLHKESSNFTLPKSYQVQEKMVSHQLWQSDNQLPNKEQCLQLINWVSEGAMVAVICNTVNDAQMLYRQLTDLANTTEAEIELNIFHARYTVTDRIRIEDETLKKYGKKAKRSGSLLIATQVVEQSLDLDFDLIVSQIAPIEFLMQRMGRLWRHDRSAQQTELALRSNVFTSPTFITLVPLLSQVESDWLQGYGGSGFVYKNIRALYRTQQYLQQTQLFSFPACYREAIDHIYQEQSFEDEPIELEKIADDYRNGQDGSFYSAKLISNFSSKPMTDVDPRSALLTREGELAQTVVLLNEAGELLHGGDFKEQSDRDKSSVSLSKKLAKGKKDETYYCLKATVNQDINYDELGITAIEQE